MLLLWRNEAMKVFSSFVLCSDFDKIWGIFRNPKFWIWWFVILRTISDEFVGTFLCCLWRWLCEFIFLRMGRVGFDLWKRWGFCFGFFSGFLFISGTGACSVSQCCFFIHACGFCVLLRLLNSGFPFLFEVLWVTGMCYCVCVWVFLCW